MGIVDDLLTNPGVYLGVDRDTDGRGSAAARIVITPLPGGGGVTIDYETFNPADADRIQAHAERAILGKTPGGGAVMVTGHVHADTVAVLHETSPGHFELGEDGSPFPMAITITVPEPGALVHVWAYGAPGEQAIDRDRAELRLVR